MSYNYRDWNRSETVSFDTLKGKTLTKIENLGEELLFYTSDGEKYRQIYYNDCCASCSVEEIHGDLEDLIGTPILMAEEVFSSDPDERAEELVKQSKDKGDYFYSDYSQTWTFYKAATIKGSVTI